MITFRPLTADEFAAFTDYFIADYAAEIVSNDRISQEDALRQARQTILSSFPDGEKTTGHVILSITDTSKDNAQPVGYLWYKPDLTFRSVFINDFYLFPAFRGQGLGRASMAALEKRLIEQGFTQIRLRVAADNPSARQLYDTAGFQVTGINMNKVLTPVSGKEPLS
ncbi:GNAT family N-acetyltransferase [Pantoea allii]|uniref:GNAT family N-acetyltransferase n=1 Tax=Pantoea allii TaxID=574096 RepID=UPI003D31EC4D